MYSGAPLSLLVFFAVLPVLLSASIVSGQWVAGRRLGEPATRTRKWVLASVAGFCGWLLLAHLTGLSGLLLRFDRLPPPMAPIILAILGTTVTLALSPFGSRLARGLPLAALVGFQAFRLPLELGMHQAMELGIMPAQMSYGGYNYDILSGISALLVALASVMNPRRLGLVAVWNALGMALLLTIMGIAIASTPLFAVFGSAPHQLNTWIGHSPFTGMIFVQVPAALFGHILVLRRLRMEWRALPAASGQRQDGVQV